MLRFFEVATDLNGIPDWWELYESVIIQGAAAGQTTQQTGHVYLSKAVESFGPDQDGNLQSDGRWNYTWDAENRLVVAETTADAIAAGVPKQHLEFGYDAYSRRIVKVVKSWNPVSNAWNMASETHFIYDNWNLIAEVDRNNAPLRSYIWGEDIGGNLVKAGGIGGLLSEIQYNSNGSTIYLTAYDGNGNITTMIRATDGHPRARYEYGPYGEQIAAFGPFVDSNPFRWTTNYVDVELNAIYGKQRYYSPSEGRWFSKDPSGESGGVNSYAYCQNDPISRFDPFGLWSKTGTDEVWIDKMDMPIQVKCGEIKITNIFIDAALDETLQRTDAAAYNSMITAIPNIPPANVAKVNSPRFIGAGFVATFQKSDECTCCDHFWWEQDEVKGWYRKNKWDYYVNGNTAMDFTGDVQSIYFDGDRTDSFKLRLYCGGSGGKKQLSETINWSRRMIIKQSPYPGTATVTLNIDW